MSYAEYISQVIICTPAELNDPEKSLLLKLIELYNRNEGIHSYLWFKKQPPIDSEDEKHLATLLDRNLIEVVHGNRFRKGGRNYALTTCGLFYILSEKQIFTVFLLSKYCENVILRLLLFQYINENTVKNWSPTVLTIISEYLHKCCVTTKRTIEIIRSSKISEEKEWYLKLLELDIKALAFYLGIRLTRLYSHYLSILKKKGLTHRDELSHEEARMFNLLSEDDKFSRFRINILKELDEAFGELAGLKAE
jgi:hypothetical protein